MRSDASDLALIGDLTDGEYDLFKAAAKALLSKTFIIRGAERDERLYDFAIRNIRLLEAWFSCADADLKRDESLGVIACRPGGEMRLRLGREETCALLVLRLLYEEKRHELSLARHPSVLVLDFAQKYRAVVNAELKKTKLVEILRRLSSCRLVGIPSDPSDPEGIIVLYPSLALTLDQAAIDEISDALHKEAEA